MYIHVCVVPSASSEVSSLVNERMDARRGKRQHQPRLEAPPPSAQPAGEVPIHRGRQHNLAIAKEAALHCRHTAPAVNRLVIDSSTGFAATDRGGVCLPELTMRHARGSTLLEG